MTLTSSPPNAAENLDAAEVAKFADHAEQWWDPQGPFATLHRINPLRLNWINQHVSLTGQRVLDVGCGAGLLSEAMALRGAQVTGLDAGAATLDSARTHAKQTGVAVDYQQATIEGFAATQPEPYPVITCMEMLEHIPDPESALAAMAGLLAPGGHLFLSTLNRTPSAFVQAIVGAEYVLRLLPTGTHEYSRFIRPSELGASLRRHGLGIQQLTGLTYSPWTDRYSLTPSVQVNYLLMAQRPAV